MREKIKALFPLDLISSNIMGILPFLVLLFFIPFSGISPEFAKYSLLSIVTLFIFFMWLMSLLQKGRISIPKTFVLYSALALLFISFLSALFSQAVRVSLFGSGTELGSVVSIGIAFLLLFLSSIYFQSTKKIFTAYGLLVLAFVIVAIVQILRIIFGADFLAMGIFTLPTSNFVGRWNDLALFSGMIAVFSLVTLELFSLKKFQKTILFVILALSIFLLAVTNFSITWILLAFFALIITIYSYVVKKSLQKESAYAKFPTVSLAVLVISLIFLFVQPVGTFFSSFSRVQNIEVRPSWSSTIGIAQESLSSDLILGSGPNRFINQWLMFKPAEINQTAFWNSDFSFAVGMIPTFAISSGLLGIIVWTLFLFAFLALGVKAIWAVRERVSENYLPISLFFISLYLWIVSFFYVPGFVIFIFAFMFTGMFVASAVRAGLVKKFNYSFLDDPRIGFASVLIIVLVMIMSVSGLYFFSKRVVANSNFAKGVVSFNSGNTAEAEKYVSKSVKLSKTDDFYRALSEVQIKKLGEVISSGTELDQDELRARFQTALGNAIGSAKKAVEYDKSDYLNWIALAKVYESVVPLGIEGSYENAVSAYSRAIELNPQSPFLQLALARLELARQDKTKAREYINKALELKENYTEAIFLLAQMDINDGNLKDAIASVEKAALIAPNDTGIFFQLGFLKYRNGDYEGAVRDLERSVILNPIYANAKYFLGLSYYKLGRNDDAIAQFEDVQTLNPENAEVKQILKNLKAGRGPLENTRPPAPEERQEPPITE